MATQLSTPTNVIGYALNYQQVRLTWDNVSLAAYYIVKYKLANNNSTYIERTNAQPGIVISGLLAEEKYDIVVIASNPTEVNGENLYENSEASNPIYVTTLQQNYKNVIPTIFKLDTPSFVEGEAITWSNKATNVIKISCNKQSNCLGYRFRCCARGYSNQVTVDFKSNSFTYKLPYPNLEYTLSIQTIGDNINYLDSDWVDIGNITSYDLVQTPRLIKINDITPDSINFDFTKSKDAVDYVITYSYADDDKQIENMQVVSDNE